MNWNYYFSYHKNLFIFNVFRCKLVINKIGQKIKTPLKIEKVFSISPILFFIKYQIQMQLQHTFPVFSFHLMVEV